MTVLNFSLLIDFQTKEINVTEHPLWSCVLEAYEERRERAKKKKPDTTPLTELTPASAGDLDSGLIPGSGRSPGEGNGSSLRYSCLENPRTEEPGGLQSMGS